MTDQGEQARLTQIEAELAEIEKARAEKQATRAATSKIEDAERRLREAKALAKSEDEHGPLGEKVATVETPRGIVIVKCPPSARMNKFLDSKQTAADVLALVRPCVVYPDLAAFDAILEEFSGLLAGADGVADKVQALSRGRAKEVSGK